MANSDNLRTLTSDEAREIGKKGGKASAKARQKKKQMRETLELLLSMPLENANIDCLENIKGFKDLKGKNITVQDAIMIAQVQKALKGDIRAAEYIRDTAGQKPINSDVLGMKQKELELREKQVENNLW